MNLALEKGERVTTGGKGRVEIGGEAGEVTVVEADAPTMDGLEKRYGTFSGWGMPVGKVEVLLVVGGFDVDRGVEVRLVNKDVNIQEGDLGKQYKMFIRWGIVVEKVEVLLMVGGFDVDGGAEARLVNKDVNIKEGDKGRGDGPGKLDRVTTIEAL